MEELCKGENLDTRIWSAVTHLQLVTNEHWLKSCPRDVAEALLAVQSSDRSENLLVMGQRIRTAVQCIFEECGRIELRIDSHSHQS